MPREGSITPADLVGKLDWLNVTCDKCGRHGRYSAARLVERLGPDAKLLDLIGRPLARVGSQESPPIGRKSSRST